MIINENDAVKGRNINIIIPFRNSNRNGEPRRYSGGHVNCGRALHLLRDVVHLEGPTVQINILLSPSAVKSP